MHRRMLFPLFGFVPIMRVRFDGCTFVKFFRVFKKTRPRRIASLLYLPNATLIDLLRHYGMKYVSHAFVLNEIQKKHLKDEFGKESSLLRSGHQRASISLNSTKKFANKIVLWAGNLGENKHPEKFIQLANQLSNSSYRFVLLGDKLWVYSSKRSIE